MGTPRGGHDAAVVRAVQGWTGLSDGDYADELGVSPRTLGRYKSGETRPVPPEVLERAAGLGEDYGIEMPAAPGDNARLSQLEAKYDELASRYDSYLDIMREEVVRAATAAVDATLQAKTATAPDTDATDHPPERTAEDPQ